VLYEKVVPQQFWKGIFSVWDKTLNKKKPRRRVPFPGASTFVAFFISEGWKYSVDEFSTEYAGGKPLCIPCFDSLEIR